MTDSKKVSLPEYEDFDSPTKEIISREEVDKLNDEYYKELFNSVPFINSDDSNEILVKSQSQPNQKISILDYVKLPLLFNIFKQSNTDIINESTQLIKSVQPINSISLNTTNSMGSHRVKQFNPLKPKNIKSNDRLQIVNEIKKSSSDPLSIIIVALICIFFYIYFANDFMCHIFGLFYPLYYLYILMHYRNTNSSEKIRSVVKYFIIYGHIEFVSSILKLAGIHFYHLKILVIICALYMTGYRQEWLNICYNNIIFYDRVFLNMVSTNTNKIYTEYMRVRSDIVNESKKKDSRKKID